MLPSFIKLPESPKKLSADRSSASTTKDPESYFALLPLNATVISNINKKCCAHFEILWLLEGTCTVAAGKKRYTIEANRLCCLAPTRGRKIHAAGEVRGYYLCFAPEFFLLSDDKLDFSFFVGQYVGAKTISLFGIGDDHRQKMETIVRNMKKELQRGSNHSPAILKSFMKIFMIYLSRHNALLSGESGAENELVQKFMALVKKQFVTKKLVSDYAMDLSVTPNYLNKIIKQVTGNPASFHIQQQIILEAKKQAIYSYASMKQVAFSLGFESYTHFSKFFKMKSGMNFTCYKNTLARP